MVVHYQDSRSKPVRVICHFKIPLHCFHFHRQVIKRLEMAKILTIEDIFDVHLEQKISHALNGCSHATEVWDFKQQVEIRSLPEKNDQNKFKLFLDFFNPEETKAAIIYTILFPLMKKNCVNVVKSLLPKTILLNPKKVQALPAA